MDKFVLVFSPKTLNLVNCPLVPPNMAPSNTNFQSLIIHLKVLTYQIRAFLVY